MNDTIRDRANRVIDEARERAREIVEMLRHHTGTRKLVPQRVPVRNNR